ncbi:cytochrome c [Polaromonas sp. UBA4122]|uniref:cytochrome c n=1 Tax=Polaromonas sp. UBA4122 TaxID=1947074 RepID=UPI0025F6855B|nr:cytochrome c [Polaromonas sp. UBA4122]
MRSLAIASIFTFALIGYAHAQTDLQPTMDHKMHMAAMANDSRQLLDFPPPMKAHMLSNMRDHLQVISEVVDAISKAQFGKAAKIAGDRLGLDSPAAEGCKAPAGTSQPQMSTPGSMEQMMAQFMPEGMRNIGYSMHSAASDFATAASEAAKTGDSKAALAALSRVTQQCVACHSVYRLQ